MIIGLLALLVSGCATGLAPRALRSDRPDYNQQVLRSTNEDSPVLTLPVR